MSDKIEYYKGVIWDDSLPLLQTPIPNRVMHLETISESIERIPFLKRFIEDDWVFTPENPIPFDRRKINAYYGHEVLTSESECTSKSINQLLEYAQTRGDI